MSKLTHFGVWSDRYNERQSYFSGSEYGQKLCECGIKDPNECFQLSNSQNMCNCDQKDPVERKDIGYITNMVRTFICFVLYLPKYLKCFLILEFYCYLISIYFLINSAIAGMSQTGGQGGAYAPPVFGRSVNPISTRGAHYPHPVLHAPPPDFQTLRHACTQVLRFLNLSKITQTE